MGGQTTCDVPRRRAALALAAALILGLTGCGGGDDGGGASGDDGGTQRTQARMGGEATFNYPTFPDALDPALSYSPAGWQALYPAYGTLLTYARKEGEAGKQLIPYLAEAMPEVSDDGRRYDMKLRPGLRYSDGSPVKASDFEHAIKRTLSLESGGATYFADSIVGAKAYVEAGRARADIPGIRTDDRTGAITVELTAPNGQFPYIVALPFAAPVPGDTPFEVLTKTPPPGTGPMTITDVEGSRRFVLERNRRWKPIPGIGEAKLDRITVDVVDNNERSVRDVLQNEVDWMDDPSPGDATREFRQRASERYTVQPSLSTYYFFLNQRLEPFDDPEVRKAVHFAVDKPALARIFGGQLEVGCNFLPPGSQGYERIDPCPFGDPRRGPDLARARRMIQAAGVAGEEVTVWGNTEESTKAVTENFVDALNKIGLRAKPRIVDGEVFVQAIGNQKTKAQAGFANWFQDFPHPANVLVLVDPDAIQQTNNLNLSNLEDPEVKRRLDELGRIDLSEAAEGYAALDRRVVENADVIPYGHRTVLSLYSERIATDQVLFHPIMAADFTTFALRR